MAISVEDVRAPEDYRQGHVPFALNVPAAVFRTHLHEPAKLAEALGAAGVNPQHEAVISTDGGLTPDAALAWWMLERMGQKKVSLLVESVDDWALGGLPIAKEPTTVGAPDVATGQGGASGHLPARGDGGEGWQSVSDGVRRCGQAGAGGSSSWF